MSYNPKTKRLQNRPEILFIQLFQDKNSSDKAKYSNKNFSKILPKVCYAGKKDTNNAEDF